MSMEKGEYWGCCQQNITEIKNNIWEIRGEYWYV